MGRTLPEAKRAQAQVRKSGTPMQKKNAFGNRPPIFVGEGVLTVDPLVERTRDIVNGSTARRIQRNP